MTDLRAASTKIALQSKTSPNRLEIGGRETFCAVRLSKYLVEHIHFRRNLRLKPSVLDCKYCLFLVLSRVFEAFANNSGHKRRGFEIINSRLDLFPPILFYSKQ